MKRTVPLLTLAALLAATPAYAQLANLKVVTDASPDYSDMESMVRSIGQNHPDDKDKMWCHFYWDHIARRQTTPMNLHGFNCTDPIRQFNDYGFLMCSTISGAKCSYWNYMGYPCRYFDIGVHTVCDVWYDGKYHHYDNSLSVHYTLPDGVTIAAVPDIGKSMAGPLSDGKKVPGYIGTYLCLNGTSPGGYIEGCDDARKLYDIATHCFAPGHLMYRSYYWDQDRGHRYILNLRDGEVYTRFTARQDVNSPNAIIIKDSHKADPAYFVPNGKTEDGKPYDPETANPRYRIRGNGERTWTPPLDEAHLAGVLHSSSNIKATANGLVPADPSKPAEAIFKVEGANVITSLKIRAIVNGKSAISCSTTNGLQWQLCTAQTMSGDTPIETKLLNEVNGSYEVLVKVALDPGASLKNISFNTITALNGKTQPKLNIGKNTIHIGAGEQTNSIVLWPEMQKGLYQPYLFEKSNIKDAENNGYQGTVHPDDASKPGYLVFKVDAPTDITSVTYGGRLYNRGLKAHIDFLHSFDGGKTWKQDYSLTDTNPPWDVIRYETITDVPAGTRSVLFKYVMESRGDDNGKGGTNFCSIYTTRMEVNHKLASPVATGTTNMTLKNPVEVTFNWSERQQDYSLLKRSHTQVVDKLPLQYTINVGGADHPIVDSVTVNLKGSRSDTKPGYSDAKDAGGEKWIGNWATYGKNFAQGKPYTLSVEPSGNWDASDPERKKITDGIVGSSYANRYSVGAIFKNNANPEITVDLEKPEKIAAFRIHTLGWDPWNAIKGENKDKVEVLTSSDGKEFTSQGFFDFKLRWKDLPVNFMWNDEETFYAHNFLFLPKAAVEARYIKFKVTSPRQFCCTEVQALDKVELKPYDLNIALPDPKDNGKAPPKADISPNAKKWADNEKPTDIGKVQQFKDN